MELNKVGDLMDDQDREAFSLSVRKGEPSPAELYPDLLVSRESLTQLLDNHLSAARAILGFTTGELYLPDLVIAGFVQRSFHLLEGFLSAFDAGNVIVAAPLVRLQIDNLIRICYLFSGVNLDEMTMFLLDGGEFRTLKDKDGRALTDKRLCELAAARHPWVAPVYEKASGWVHFSGSHVHTVCRAGERPGVLEGAFPLRTEFIPRSLFSELLGAMGTATEEILLYLRWWGEHKLELAGRETDDA